MGDGGFGPGVSEVLARLRRAPAAGTGATAEAAAAAPIAVRGLVHRIVGGVTEWRRFPRPFWLFDPFLIMPIWMWGFCSAAPELVASSAQPI